MRWVLTGCALALVASTASATVDMPFTFSYGPTVTFESRTNVPGTVTGILHGLYDTGSSDPTSIEITSTPAALGVLAGNYSPDIAVGGIITLDDVVVDANLLLNFSDSAGNAFQLRLNCADLGGGRCEGTNSALNSLFWNGGSTPHNGTGNQLGFAGTTYGPGTVYGPRQIGDVTPVPEPSTWMMMLLGFGLIGIGMKRRASRSGATIHT
jgi:hypothetical protein